MIDYVIISGSGFYNFEEINRLMAKSISTQYGTVEYSQGELNGKQAAFLSRHKNGHALLPNMINYKANISMCGQLKAKAIIATTICGIMKPDIPLARPLLFNDIFYIDNRLPSGEICSFFTEPKQAGRGHLMFSNPFYDVADSLGDETIISGLTYGCANGPRFNSKAEITFMKKYCDAISQTCGPEVILANELEIPYILLGFGVDYANGIKSQPTPVEELNKNMARSKEDFKRIIGMIIKLNNIKFNNYVYRFDAG